MASGEYVAPAPPVSAAPALVGEYIAPTPAVFGGEQEEEYIPPPPAVSGQAHWGHYFARYYSNVICCTSAPSGVHRVTSRLRCTCSRRGPRRAQYQQCTWPCSWRFCWPAHAVPRVAKHLSLSRQTRLMSKPRVERASRLRQAFLSRRRPVDEAEQVLDVQVEGVMRASVARLGYEWTRTRRREKQLEEALVITIITNKLKNMCPKNI